MVTLFAFVVRRPDMSHEEFLAYWRGVHGPLIRDTPALARHIVSYRQHARIPGPNGGSPDYDGVAVQQFESWDEFMAMLHEPEAQVLLDDEPNFLDREKLRVVFSTDVVTMIDGGD